MCIHCGNQYVVHTPPTHNWFPSSSYPCNPCVEAEQPCKKLTPIKCIEYANANLPNIEISGNAKLKDIIDAIDAKFGDLEGDAILEALNDINQRLVALTGVSHPPYTL